MAKQPIKFKTVLSNFTKGGKPCYVVRVVNNGTRYLKDADEIAEIAREINKRKQKVETLKKDLADDFETNEKAYRGGIRTASGVLYRKPRWDVTAKENVVVED